MMKKNKLFQYGLDAGSIGRILLDPDPVTPVPQPKQVFTEEVHYWPDEALPFANAAACVDVVLSHSREAVIAFREAVKSLDLPGCQSIIGQAKKHAPETGKWAGKVMQEQGEKPAFPVVWSDTYDAHKDNVDYVSYIERVREFIRVGFNRSVDIVNNECKVKLENAPTLYYFIIIRTIAEYCKVQIESWNKYRPDNVDRLMAGKPTTRHERQTKKAIIQAYKLNNWALHHDEGRQELAKQWYQSRVVFSGAEEYSREEFKKPKGTWNDPSNIRRAIADFDEVTGYPRKWRK